MSYPVEQLGLRTTKLSRDQTNPSKCHAIGTDVDPSYSSPNAQTSVAERATTALKEPVDVEPVAHASVTTRHAVPSQCATSGYGWPLRA